MSVWRFLVAEGYAAVASLTAGVYLAVQADQRDWTIPQWAVRALPAWAGVVGVAVLIGWA